MVEYIKFLGVFSFITEADGNYHIIHALFSEHISVPIKHEIIEENVWFNNIDLILQGLYHGENRKVF